MSSFDYEDEADLDSAQEGIVAQLDVVLKRNEELQKQSELFMSYLRRNHQSTEVEEKQEKSKRRQRREKKIVTLTAEQLITVASHENDALQKEIGQTRKEVS